MSFADEIYSPIFVGCFTGVTLTSGLASDIFTYTGSTACRTVIERFVIGERSSNVVANQQIGISAWRGVTPVTTANGGGAATAMANMRGYSAALSTGYGLLQAPTSAVALTSAGTGAQLVHADTSDFGGNMRYEPKDGREIVLDAGQAVTFRGSAPAVSIVIDGHLQIRQVPLKG